ncbi:MAG: bifunctional phosphopantothenoylcysteine decarboxylase/phosphopantothenate--cysteine ligase CoaBC [Ginsengibacter sp.]
MLTGKKILLCVTGSIAAYKSIILLRLLIKAGVEVKVVLTEGAKDFVTPLTFSTLSKNKVITNLFDEDTWANHVLLGRWADIMVIAPASCNTLSKMSNGLCDNLLLAVYLSSRCPVVIAPAMDEDMWHHPATQRNVDVLKKDGNQFLPVNKGELASGLSGEGRMIEPEEIVRYLDDFFLKKMELKGLRAMVTAGPTYEKLDPVRFIGNHSSGKMGISIAEELLARGASVTLVLGPSKEVVKEGIKTIRVISAKEMYEACMKDAGSYDIIVMAAAVADYTPKKVSIQKIKKKADEFSVELLKTRDILLEVGKLRRKDQTLVGFALETTNEKTNALKKLTEKNADFIVMNSLNDENAGFGYDTNKITIFDRTGKESDFPAKPKKEVAIDIVNAITQFRNE